MNELEDRAIVVLVNPEQLTRAKQGYTPGVMSEIRYEFEQKLLAFSRKHDIPYVKPQGRTMP